MKIALFGGIANNMYIMAKVLNEHGYETTFIKDEQAFLFSQPFWEDISLTENYSELHSSIKWNKNNISEYEKHLNWKQPHWVKTIQGENSLSIFKKKLDRNDHDNLFDSVIYHLYEYKRKILYPLKEMLSQADCSIVCGQNGILAASQSRKPFIIWPHGEDFRKAAGFSIDNNEYFAFIWNALIQKRLLKNSFLKAHCVGSHSPHFGYENEKNMIHLLKAVKIKHLPIPLDIEERKEKIIRRKLLTSLFNELSIECPKSEWIFFIPSRMSNEWKGTNHLVKAIQTLFSEGINKNNVNFIFSSWGDNFLEIKNTDYGELITFLPFVLSKPYLYRVFQCVDVVIDQFVQGVYGTSAVEAMSRGAPVMMYIDNNIYKQMGWEPPPVININKTNKIKETLFKIITNKIDLKPYEKNTFEWIKKVHSKKNFMHCFEKNIKDLC